MHIFSDRFGFVYNDFDESDDLLHPSYSELWQNILSDLSTPERCLFLNFHSFIINLNYDTCSLKVGLAVAPSLSIKNIAVNKRQSLEESASRILMFPVKVQFMFLSRLSR